MKKVLLFIGLLISIFAHAQERAERFFQEQKLDTLKNTVGQSTCVTIDVSSALDTNNQPYTYVWDLGDGQKKVGATVRHCYPANELYSPSLTLADSVLEVYIENEIVLNVDLRMDTMFIDGTDSISVGNELKFSPAFISGKHYNVDAYFWDLGNGKYSSSTIAKATYSETGTYKIRLGAIITKKDKKYTVLCEKKISVFNIITPKSLIDAFNNTQTADDKISRYLQEDIFFTLYDTTHDKYQFVESIEKIGYRIELEENCVYQIYTKRGNIFSDIITFSTFNTKNKYEVQNKFKEAISEITKSEHLHRIPALYFQQIKAKNDHLKTHRRDRRRERSLTKESKEELKNVATILIQYPTLKVCIGSYTHTGYTAHLRFKRGLYEDRAVIIKEKLIRKGVLPAQIEYTTHLNTETLINSCDGCSKENSSFNRRSEFKVIHITEPNTKQSNQNDL